MLYIWGNVMTSKKKYTNWTTQSWDSSQDLTYTETWRTVDFGLCVMIEKKKSTWKIWPISESDDQPTASCQQLSEVASLPPPSTIRAMITDVESTKRRFLQGIHCPGLTLHLAVSKNGGIDKREEIALRCTVVFSPPQCSCTDSIILILPRS